MADLNNLRFYTANGAKYTEDQSSTLGIISGLLISLTIISFAVFGILRANELRAYIVGGIAIILFTRVALQYFTKTEFDLSTKLMIQVKFFGLKKQIHRFDEFTRFNSKVTNVLLFKQHLAIIDLKGAGVSISTLR